MSRSLGRAINDFTGNEFETGYEFPDQDQLIASRLDNQARKEMAADAAGRARELQGDQLAAQTQWKAADNALDSERNGLQKYKLDLGQARWAQMWQNYQGMLNSPGAVFGAHSANGPPISVAPIYSPGMINQAANADRATVMATNATNKTHGNAEQLAGRGFGGNSMLLSALDNASDSAANQTAVSQGLNIRQSMAKENAGHVLNAQVAKSDQFKGLRDIDAKIYDTEKDAETNKMIAALSGLASNSFG